MVRLREINVEIIGVFDFNTNLRLYYLINPLSDFIIYNIGNISVTGNLGVMRMLVINCYFNCVSRVL
jgi:hypothetical protein